MQTLIIIPTYNEVENIETLVNNIYSQLKNNFSILISDDNSSDGTKTKIIHLQNKFPNIQSISQSRKMGLANAYIEGLKYGLKNGFDVFIEMDADFSHDPKYLPEFLEQIKTNDLVIGSRYIKNGQTKNWKLIRKIISKLGCIYSKLILNTPIKDLTGGYNCWNKSVLEKINLDTIISKGYAFQIEMKYKAHKHNAKIKEIPITFIDRKKGKSKLDLQIIFEAFINVLRIKFDISK